MCLLEVHYGYLARVLSQYLTCKVLGKCSRKVDFVEMPLSSFSQLSNFVFTFKWYVMDM